MLIKQTTISFFELGFGSEALKIVVYGGITRYDNIIFQPIQQTIIFTDDRRQMKLWTTPTILSSNQIEVRTTATLLTSELVFIPNILKIIEVYLHTCIIEINMQVIVVIQIVKKNKLNLFFR